MMIYKMFSLVTALVLLAVQALIPIATECKLCGGQGICMDCLGVGTFECFDCIDGQCFVCEGGRYRIGMDAEGNHIYKDCSLCTDGQCNRCMGTGRMDCPYCHDGKCLVCRGKGHW
ncbi:MAG: hypothetical protein ACI3V0_11270 [Faecousia sp.]